MLNRKKTAVAVAMALGASAAALTTAQAGQLWFPQGVVSPSVSTIFSVINTKAPGPDVKQELHYRYYYKVKGPATGDPEADEDAFNAQVCSETNRYLPTSKYDIQTIDIAGVIDGEVSGVLFNDPSFNNQWQQSGKDFAMARGGPTHRGYLIVEHPATYGLDSDEVGLYGEAIIFEFGSGAAWGYQGFAKAGDESNPRCNFRRARSNSPSNVAVFPFANTNFTTKFMVTPGYRPDGTWDSCPDGSKNENTTYLTFETYDDRPNSVIAAMYDRDENPISGAVEKKVTCIGAVTAEYMIDPLSRSQLVDGGWGGVTNYAKGTDGFDATTGAPVRWEKEASAVIYKLEYGLTDELQPGTPGIYNNAEYLHPGFVWNASLDVDPNSPDE